MLQNVFFNFLFGSQLPGSDLTKVESMMGEVESHYFPIGQSQSHSSSSHHQNAASKELMALLWRMLVLVENRAASSELWVMLHKSSSFCEGIEAVIS
jgi:hypothetical protein